jgi:glycolate oxidase iron-sulfur subunit
VQQALRPSINSAALRMLAANGVEVLVPPEQGCCGALALHVGEEERAHTLTMRNKIAFTRDADAIITTAAGCGSAMKEQRYPVPVYDVLQFLATLGIVTRHALPDATMVAYHDACHLSHGQGIRTEPRRLLQHIDKLRLAELDDGEMCCGSAGLYNLEHPEPAAALGRRKAQAIAATGAQAVAAANIGCIAQIEAYLDIPVRHPIELLDSSYIPQGATRRD